MIYPLYNSCGDIVQISLDELKNSELQNSDETKTNFNLGVFNQYIEKNHELAKKYYLMAIDKGDANAMNNLGVIYTEIEKDYESAKKYYLMAIDNGDANAMCNLFLL